MDMKSERLDEILVIPPEGILGGFGASKLDEILNKLIKNDDLSLVFDLKDVPYLSSGGPIR